MIHAEGYAATGIQSIVDGADVPKGSFYNHFPSKEAFGAEVIDVYSDRGQRKLRDFLCNPDVAPLARLEAYFDDRIEAFRASNYTRGCLLGNFSAEAADHSALVREFNSWEGAVLRMRVEKSDAPLIEFKDIIFGKLLA